MTERIKAAEISLATLAAAVILALLTASSLVWIARDHAVWPWDQAWYGETALDVWAARSRGLHAWLVAMITAMGSKPPLLPWIAQFFIPLSSLGGGRVEPAMLLVNVVCQGAIFVLLVALGRRLGCRPIDTLTGALIGTGASLTFGVTDQFLVEPLLDLVCVLVMWEAWTAVEANGWRLAAGLAFTAALGFLTKASAFVFVVPYLVYVIVARLATRGGRRARSDRTTVPAVALAVIAVVACALWYKVNWAPMRQHFIDATSDQVALMYGSVGSFSAKFSFWSRAAAVGLSPWPWLLVLPVLLVLAGMATHIPRFVRLKTAALGAATRSGWLFAGASAGLVLVTLIGMSFQIEEETRFVITIYPPLGIAVAWALSALGRRWLSVPVFVVFALNTLWNIGISEGMWTSPWPQSVWLKPYSADARGMALLRSVVAETCPPDHDPSYRVIGNEYPSFNANSAAFYAATQRRAQGSTCPYTGLGYAEKDATRALKRLDDLPAQEVVFIAPDKEPPADAFNAVSLAVIDSLRSDPRFKLTVSDNGEVWIFSRRELAKP